MFGYYWGYIKTAWNYIRSQKGDMAEKAVIMAIIILMTLAALTFLATRIANTFNRVGSAMP